MTIEQKIDGKNCLTDSSDDFIGCLNVIWRAFCNVLDWLVDPKSGFRFILFWFSRLMWICTFFVYICRCEHTPFTLAEENKSVPTQKTLLSLEFIVVVDAALQMSHIRFNPPSSSCQFVSRSVSSMQYTSNQSDSIPAKISYFYVCMCVRQHWLVISVLCGAVQSSSRTSWCVCVVMSERSFVNY